MIRLDRYSGGLAATALLAAAGLVRGSAVLLIAATVPVVFVAYGALTRVRLEPADLTVERSVDRPSPLPGERVRVRVTVENDGPAVGDLRVADGAPPDLPVVDGNTRGSFALPSGGTATVEYALLARRGSFEFGPVAVRARDASGAAVETRELDPDGTDRLTCEPAIDSAPLRRQTGRFAGAVRTEVGGSGVEFHSTREYRRGDPVNRIDWRRLAKTGDLTTVDYREHRSARVLLLVDSRKPCHVAQVEGAPSAAAVCAHAAGRLLPALLSAGHAAGTAALGLVDATGGPAVVEPDTGDDHELRARELLEAAGEPPDDVHGPGSIPGDPPDTPDSAGPGDVPGPVEESGGPGPDAPGGANGDPASDGEGPGPGEAGGPGPGEEGGSGPGPGEEGGGGGSGPGDQPGSGRGTVPDGGPGAPGDDPVRTLSGRLPAETQVFLFSPVLDAYPETAVRTLRALGHRVTVVSPDVTSADAAGARLLAVERELHLEGIRAAGARVVDWNLDRPLPVALAGVLEDS